MESEIKAGFDEMLGPPAQRPIIGVRFFIEPMKNEAKSKEEGRDIFEDVEMIEKRVPGSRDIVRRPVSEQDKRDYPTLYAVIRNQEEQEKAEGYPLREWSGITRSQAEELRYFGLRTVEHLAGASDEAIQRIGPLMALRQKARDWLEMAKKGAVVNKLRSENQDLRVRVETLERMLAAQAADIAAARNAGGVLAAAPVADPKISALEAQIAQIAAVVAKSQAAPVESAPARKRPGRPPGSKNKPKVPPNGV